MNVVIVDDDPDITKLYRIALEGALDYNNTANQSHTIGFLPGSGLVLDRHTHSDGGIY